MAAELRVQLIGRTIQVLFIDEDGNVQTRADLLDIESARRLAAALNEVADIFELGTANNKTN